VVELEEVEEGVVDYVKLTPQLGLFLDAFDFTSQDCKAVGIQLSTLPYIYSGR